MIVLAASLIPISHARTFSELLDLDAIPARRRAATCSRKNPRGSTPICGSRYATALPFSRYEQTVDAAIPSRVLLTVLCNWFEPSCERMPVSGLPRSHGRICRGKPRMHADSRLVRQVPDGRYLRKSQSTLRRADVSWGRRHSKSRRRCRATRLHDDCRVGHGAGREFSMSSSRKARS
jgi:hypothetical protein